ncbi:tRNA/rRNA methyltransferase (SpoU) [Prochlorococcus marinus subsp. pastoris str. CCMP1986]|uniref:tRNA (guanosine(18)-2'-O)-methyltransferase n=1 Tax=Prochlorococcus marinus subsp. pastoris (strain CCMP1986 / NIES-2087 / MED4) TaxID=59919 RepID=Q7TUD5_PROMP|nr:TrmH family RNA methyltransferase [Prochlorococcus marinus]KGF86231.1 tRNA (Guanosine18-2'-O-) -methyltransferase [Prochlorococcus marinus str. EQPAC1]CAE18881.1 tRNA/rRNA methyltransferase (SpoU) [Prochlorococcus marinus subsp. pastoris str. CCMP1986]
MSILPRRFERIKNVLNCRMRNLTVLVEAVNKPHNLSAILRTCDAAGVFEANFISEKDKVKTFNSTAQGSQKWVKLNNHETTISAVSELKKKGFKLYGTTLNERSTDYRNFDYSENTCFVLGAEKWGLSDQLISKVDESIFIPMSGMVQSLNVSVATSILLFEAIRQRKSKSLLPLKGEGLSAEEYEKTLFEWSYPDLASIYRKSGNKYPKMNQYGEINEVVNN